MADKIYQTEGAMEMAASIKPMSGGYYLATAEDIYIGDNKSLADYIAAGGGGGGGSGLPDYTEADNGKFLQIVGGSPAWVLIEDGDEVEY
jgi:hypothetical protein